MVANRLSSFCIGPGSNSKRAFQSAALVDLAFDSPLADQNSCSSVSGKNHLYPRHNGLIIAAATGNGKSTDIHNKLKVEKTCRYHTWNNTINCAEQIAFSLLQSEDIINTQGSMH
jgi:hypothetical protein